MNCALLATGLCFCARRFFLIGLTIHLLLFSGTSLQEIKVDCDIDDRASIAVTKKGKVWEVSGIEGKRFEHLSFLEVSCIIIWTYSFELINYLIASNCFSCWRSWFFQNDVFNCRFFWLRRTASYAHTVLQLHLMDSLSWKKNSRYVNEGWALIRELELLVLLSLSLF